MAAGYPWFGTDDPVTEDPGVRYWRERALRAEREARRNRDLAEFTRDMGLAVCKLATKGKD